MTVSLAEATAAAHRILARSYRFEPTFDVLADADLLAAFVLAGDTERLREALTRYGVHEWECPARWFPDGKCDCGLAAALAEESP